MNTCISVHSFTDELLKMAEAGRLISYNEMEKEALWQQIKSLVGMAPKEGNVLANAAERYKVMENMGLVDKIQKGMPEAQRYAAVTPGKGIDYSRLMPKAKEGQLAKLPTPSRAPTRITNQMQFGTMPQHMPPRPVQMEYNA